MKSIRLKYVKNGIEAIKDNGMPLLYRPGDPRYSTIEDLLMAGRREVDETVRWRPRAGVDY